MHVGFVAWLFAVSVGASALGGALGMASGIFIVPILTMFGGLDFHAAVSASIVSVIACSCGSAAPFLSRETLGGMEETNSRDWATVLRLHSSYPDHALGREVFYRVRSRCD